MLHVQILAKEGFPVAKMTTKGHWDLRESGLYTCKSYSRSHMAYSNSTS